MNFRFKVPRIYRKLFPEIDHIKDDEQQFRAFAEAWQSVWPTAVVFMILIAYASSTINHWGLEIVMPVGEYVAQFLFMLICLPLFMENRFVAQFESKLMKQAHQCASDAGICWRV